MTGDCYTDADGCYICPARPARPAVPAHFASTPITGFGTAGAVSSQELDGPLQVVWNPANASGVIIGLRTGRNRAEVPVVIEHGVYLQQIAHGYVAQCMSYGRRVGPATAASAASEIMLRRTGGVVQAFVDEVAWYSFFAPSVGPKTVGGCLYATGDELPQ